MPGYLTFMQVVIRGVQDVDIEKDDMYKVRAESECCDAGNL